MGLINIWRIPFCSLFLVWVFINLNMVTLCMELTNFGTKNTATSDFWFINYCANTRIYL